MQHGASHVAAGAKYIQEHTITLLDIWLVHILLHILVYMSVNIWVTILATILAQTETTRANSYKEEFCPHSAAQLILAQLATIKTNVDDQLGREKVTQGVTCGSCKS